MGADVNDATKGTGMAAALAIGTTMTVVWALDTFAGVKVPDAVNIAWQGLLTVVFGYLVHRAQSAER